MSETTVDATTTDKAPQQAQDAAGDKQQTFDAEYVANLRKEAAKYRTEAKQATEALTAAQQSSMSEAEKTAARIKALEDAVAASSTQALRYRIAAANGITNEDADLFLTGQDEETLTAQATRLAAKTAQPGTPKPDLTQGGSGGPVAATPEQAFVAFTNTI